MALNTQPISDALWDLGAQIRKMQQRMPHTHFFLEDLWAKDRLASATLREIEQEHEELQRAYDKQVTDLRARIKELEEKETV